MLEHFIPSKTRRKILALFYSDITKIYHLRQISREVDEEINAVKRELDILEKSKFVIKEKRINKMIFTINQKHIFFDDFLRIFFKENHLIKDFTANQSKLGKVKLLTISKKLPLREKINPSEIYILLIGIVVAAEVNQIIKNNQHNFPYEINYSIMDEEEFLFRKKNNDPFIGTYLKQPQIVIVGSEDYLRL